ncbi:AAA family ATPase [Polaribacter pectinis]|uniref:AAA family ATPase n=1 Tax=Polaribacter pectinis TaxID=2738844 RepID=A0A7G9L7J8_9FLAO|nr:AAA family ATPase [Polaribacter pectinis]QNM84597.1 AAA family ATPase [Polaribacter pectinis]
METIKLSNFRKVKDSWDLDLAPITFFTGTNNSGKSTVIKSLLLLEDYVKSNNHFELNFHGENFYKHKIESYKNAVNRTSFINLKKDLVFEYKNKGYDISLTFEIGENNLIGFLKKMKFKREDKATLEISQTSSKTYQLQIDAFFLNQRIIDNKEEEDKLNTLALELTVSNIIEMDKEELKGLYAEFDKYSHKMLLMNEYSYTGDNTLDLNSEETKDLANVYLKYDKIIEENRKKIIDVTQNISDGEKKLKKIQQKLNKKGQLIKDRLMYSPTFSLEDFGISDRRIDKILRIVLPQYLVDNNLGNNRIKNNFKNSDESLELDKANKLGDELLLALSFNTRHLSPHRSNQSKLFIHENKNVDINYLTKNHFEKQLHADIDVQKFMKKWMSKDYFDIGEDYKISTYESTVSKIEIYEDETWINLSDKGFGAGQIFSILLAIASSIIETQGKIAKKGALFEQDLSIILIEEPEANLHPGLQSKLAELFLDANREFGINFILETHSEYMIRMSQIIVKQINEKDENAKIPFEAYYFDKDAKPYSMIYRKDGKFTNEFGSGFFDVSSNLAFDIL